MLHETDVAIVNLLVVVVLDLHHLVSDRIGRAEFLNARLGPLVQRFL